MADLPSEPVVDVRLRDFLAAELRQAELDFPNLPRTERPSERRRLPVGVVLAALVVLGFVAVAPLFLEGVVGTGGTPLGADGLPLSIDGEPVVRGGGIASHLSGGSFLAGGTLALDTTPCASRNPRAQLGCVEGWELVTGPLANPAVFLLDGIADAPGFVRTTGAPTVARVHALAAASGPVRDDALVVEAIAWRQPTKGPIPEDATPPGGGTVNDALVPDFVSVWGSDGVTIAGYAPKRYLLEPSVGSGNPSNPPQSEPVPVYGEDLTTLVGHMVPGVGFVAMGSTAPPARPTVSMGPSVAPPSPAPSPLSAVGDCGTISPDACAQAIALARAGHEDEVVGATRIVVSDTCPPPGICDRLYPFDTIVVFVTAGADTTGWYAFHVFGLGTVPTDSESWQGAIPLHVIARLQEPEPTP
jgi:hypothetical protein